MKGEMNFLGVSLTLLSGLGLAQEPWETPINCMKVTVEGCSGETKSWIDGTYDKWYGPCPGSAGRPSFYFANHDMHLFYSEYYNRWHLNYNGCGNINGEEPWAHSFTGSPNPISTTDWQTWRCYDDD